MPQIKSKAFRKKQSKAHQYKKELERKATLAELWMRAILKQLNIRHLFQKGFIAEDFLCICDFFLCGRGIVVEVDGGYHLEKNKWRDHFKNEFLTKRRNMGVIRIPNQEVFKMTAADFTALLAKSFRGGVLYSKDYFQMNNKA